MRKKDTNCEKSDAKKELVDPESVVEASYENGNATPAEMRRRHLVIIRHAAGVQLVATAPLLALAWETARQWQLPMTLLILPVIIAGLAGASYGWAAYGKIASKAIEGDDRGSAPDRSEGNPRRPIGSVIHTGIIVIPMLLAPAFSAVHLHVPVITACSFVMAVASRVMWAAIVAETSTPGSAAGRD